MKPGIQRSLIYFSILLYLFSGCQSECDNEAELAFAPKQQKRLEAYKDGDTIYFSDGAGNKDTIAVSAIESWTNNCMLHATGVDIKHLPDNLWSDGSEIKNGKLVQLDQRLLLVEKQVDNIDEYVSIHYRNFSGRITDDTETRSDSLFHYCHQRSYLVVENEDADSEKFKQDSLHIMKIFWTEKYGLSGYELRNGSVLRIEK